MLVLIVIAMLMVVRMLGWVERSGEKGGLYAVDHATCGTYSL